MHATDPDTAFPMPRSLLIVDDSEVQRCYATALARDCGVEALHEAVDGAAALELLARLDLEGRRPEALLVDLEMPVMDGVEFIQQLADRGLEIPFVVASTREAPLLEAVRVMAGALGRPAAAVLQKPFGRPALRAALLGCKPVARSRAAAAPVTIDAWRLRQAIEAGAIVPHYQPKVDAGTGLLRGVEALARWHDPVLGQVPPDAFVAAAEAASLIHALTLSILDQALAQAARWRSRGLQPSVAINLSPKLLTSAPALVAEIGDLSRRHAVRSDQVVFEITESGFVGQEGRALATLARLRMQGYGLSIDDYGTGFSSMQQLASIPFTELKIDRSLVEGAHVRASQRVILQSAIETASRLGITSVAEGVETIESWRMVQSLGCSLAQGWLIGKAMPGDEVPAWLRQHAACLPALRAPAGWRAGNAQGEPA